MKNAMRIILIALGVLWASPVTLANLVLHILPLWALGAYEYVGRRSYVLAWALRPKKSLGWHVRWVGSLWRGWAANSAGNAIVFREHPDRWNSARIQRHEIEHTLQVMKLGIFQPLLYILSMIALRIVGNADPYADNPFEIAARRAAGQPIDVFGIREQIKKRMSE